MHCNLFKYLYLKLVVRVLVLFEVMVRKTTHIILTDDDADDHLIFSDALSELKIDSKLTIFSDGLELMEYLKNAAILPNVLFLDLNMPKKTGLDCLREIRSDKKFKKISIAIYSTSSSPKDIEETFLKGANLYVQKPSDFTKLKLIIKKVILTKWKSRKTGVGREGYLIGT